MKALSKAAAEIQLWRSRYETEGMGRIEELEAGRSKLQSRILEAEETVDSLQTKIANVEKARARLNTELEEMAMDYERVHAATLIAEKRSKNLADEIKDLLDQLGDGGRSIHDLDKQRRRLE